jgi:hypothetical protein
VLLDGPAERSGDEEEDERADEHPLAPAYEEMAEPLEHGGKLTPLA